MTIVVTDDPEVTVVLADTTEIVVQSLTDNSRDTIDFSAGFSVNGGVITNHGSPTNPTDVVNKLYVDTSLSGSIGVSIQGYSSVLQASTASFTTALLTKLNGIEASAKDDQSAFEVPYSNTVSGLTSIQVQGALDELDGILDNVISGSTNISFSNTISKLNANTVKGAIDELAVRPYVTVTTNTTIDPKNYITYVDATSGDIIITLPTAVGNQGKPINIKRIDNSTNVVTLDSQVGESIDNVSSGNLHNFDSITVISNNSNWFIL